MLVEGITIKDVQYVQYVPCVSLQVPFQNPLVIGTATMITLNIKKKLKKTRAREETKKQPDLVTTHCYIDWLIFL